MEDRALPLRAHLIELRNRIFISVLVVLVAGILGFVFSDWLIALLMAPLPEGLSLAVFSVVEGFFVKLKLGFLFGFIFSSPIVFWILWGFVAPGLTPKERRAIGPVLPAVFFLFALGALFTWWVVLPNAIPVLLGFAKEFQPVLRVDWYVGFASGIIAAGGLLFEMPIFLVALRKLGLVDARLLVRYFRHAVVVIVFVVAILSPTPDAINLTLLSLPAILLYLVSILLVARVRPIFESLEEEGEE